MNNPFTLLQEIRDDIRAIRQALVLASALDETDPTLKKILEEVRQGTEAGWKVDEIFMGYDVAYRCQIPPEWNTPFGLIRTQLSKSTFPNHYNIYWKK